MTKVEGNADLQTSTLSNADLQTSPVITLPTFAASTVSMASPYEVLVESLAQRCEDEMETHISNTCSDDALCAGISLFATDAADVDVICKKFSITNVADSDCLQKAEDAAAESNVLKGGVMVDLKVTTKTCQKSVAAAKCRVAVEYDSQVLSPKNGFIIALKPTLVPHT
jgi:hypothetical protein